MPALDTIPSGLIVMWSGFVNDVPAGWALCDGTLNTPDLRDRFVLGAGADVDPGEKGGSRSVTLALEHMPAHTHAYSNFGAVSDDWRSGGDSSPGNATGGLRGGQTTEGAGGGSSFEVMPPFFSLCFIMKRGLP